MTDPRNSRNTLLAFFFFACLWFPLAATIAGAETTPSAERGLSSDTAYSMGDVDQVNLFSGNLTVTLPLSKSYPLGPSSSYGLTLIYNSNGWVSTEQVCGNGGGGGTDYNLPEPDPRNNAGFGWRVSLGQFFPPDTPPHNADVTRSVFITPDGGEHLFANELHPDQPATPQAGTSFSVDSTYLRMKTSGCVSAAPPFGDECRKIESPDGSTHEFRHYSAAATDWRIARYADSFGNDLDITYSANTWTLTDIHGRVHKVNFDANGNVDSVVTEGIGGSDVTYDLQYGAPVAIDRQEYGRPTTCVPQAPANTVSVRFLDRLLLPDGSFYDFTYLDNDEVSEDVLSGGMASLRLPTGGEIRYSYRRDFYLGEVTSGNPLVRANGIATRSLFEDPTGAATGTWTYDLVTGDNPPSPSHTGPGQAPPCYHTRVVTDPLGNVTENFFSTIKNLRGWAYGLPFTYCDPDDGSNQTNSAGPFVSQRLYQGAAIPANLVREIQVTYTADGRAPQSLEVQGWNTRMTKRVEVYTDDNDNQRTTDFANFDGVGHWRSVTTSGSFGPTKSVSTDWNSGLGTLTTNPNTTTGSGFTMPGSATAWIWGFHTESSITQGTTTSKTELAFDSTTGALLRQRILAGTSRANHDVLKVLERDAAGFVTTEKVWGGDANAETFDNVYAALADMDLPTDETEEYRVNHTYIAGVPATSKYVNPCDDAEVYLVALDQTIDANSGLPTSVRDASGFETSLVYDGMLRLKREEPEEGAWTTYTYRLPTVATPNQLPEFEVHACKPGFSHDPCQAANSLASNFTEYDGLSRKLRYAVSFPTEGDPSTSQDRKYTYNALGWLLEETTWGRQKMTTYSSFDRFGRPGLISPPGQTSIFMAYKGDRVTARKTQVETLEGSRFSCHQEHFDLFGRLIQVRENFLAAGGNCLNIAGTLTSYDYDEKDRLTGVCQNDSGSSCGQIRAFSYDGRGVLTAEAQPEIGPSGNGATSYTYDSMGNVLARDIAGSDNHSLRYNYDGAGRLTHVRQVINMSGTTRLLKEFRYARDNDLGWSQSKLVEAIRWNWVSLNVPPLETFDEPGASPVQVTNRYKYNGTAGRISEKLTTQRAGSSALAFRSSYTYDNLGNLKTLAYPQCLSGECAGEAPARTVTYSYANGFLTSVAGFASQIWYQEGGMLDTINYSNGVSWSQSVNTDNDLPRPHEIMITGTSDNTDSNTGTYAYDGSGNITAIGGLAFRYDLLNRLTSGQARNGQGGTPFQTVAFDAYGNITQMTTDSVTRPLPASTSTNRLNGAGMSYDAAGNLTAANVDGFTFAYTYDALNTMKFYQSQSESKVFSYDADGERLESFRCPANVCGPGEGNERITLRGLNGEVLRVYEGGPGNRPWVEDYVYADGRALARVKSEPGGPATEYLHFDHLGSVRKVTDEAGAQVEYHEYFPFGDEATAASSDDSTLKFTGHERDEGSGQKDELDYMHARFCGTLLGRFLSVDGLPTLGSAMHDTRRWNRYSYAAGNPLLYIDPTGNYIILIGSSAEEAQVSLEAIQSALQEVGAGDLANLLVVTEVNGEYRLDTEGDLSLFTESSIPSAELIGKLIGDDTPVLFEVTNADLSDHGGAVTESAPLGTSRADDILIRINPAQVAKTTVEGIFTSGPFEGQAGRFPVGLGTAVVHEFGHASGYALYNLPRYGSDTNGDALLYENLHRALLAKGCCTRRTKH